MADARPRIAVFSGPMATISNSAPLVTSNQARARWHLPLMLAPDGRPAPDVLRPQRLAAPVTVYVEAYSAHPLEAESAELYAPPDGWLDETGTYHEGTSGASGTPVYRVELHPENGLLPLPYMGRQADGSAWDETTAEPLAGPDRSRQTFYPDASRVYEEIDRVAVDRDGRSVALAGRATFDFYRAAPTGGWPRGRAAADRTDVGTGDIAPETLGLDYFAYHPMHLYREPPLAALAAATSMVQRVLAGGAYAGAQWLESSATIEETLYWFGLLVDTTVPIVGHSAQRAHGIIGADGVRNIVDGVKYLLSGTALDDTGRDRIGPVLIVDEVVFAAREVVKVDARPGGYTTGGGHGGIVADMGGFGPPQVTFVPARRHTHISELRLPLLPETVVGVAGAPGKVTSVEVRVKNGAGDLLPDALPVVSFTKRGTYSTVATTGTARPDADTEVEVLARIADNLARRPLAGFVAEGNAPYGSMGPTANAALALATFSGMPVVRVGRGNPGGMAYPDVPTVIAGNNLSATKARVLLMAALLKFGALPPAADPRHPTDAEVDSTRQAIARFQHVFDTH